MSELPLTFDEWCKTSGASVAAVSFAENEPEKMAEVEEVAHLFNEDVLDLSRQMMAAYHAYVCAFIAADREERS